MDEVSELRARVSELERALEAGGGRGARVAGQLRRLAGAAVVLSRAGSVDELLARASEQARTVVGAHQAVVSMTAGDDWARAHRAISLSDAYAPWRSYDVSPDGSGIYAWVCDRNEPVRMTQAQLESHPAWRGFGPQAGDHPPLRGWLAAPLVSRDGTNRGLVQLSDRVDGGDFDADDEAVTVHLAALVAAELERVTRLQAAETAMAELQRQHELTQTIAENASSALFLMDAEGRPTYQNSAAVAMFGFDLDEIRHRPLHEAVHHTRPDGTPYPIGECPIDRALPERRWVEPYEDLFLRKDGTFVPVAAAASPILRDGVPVGTVVEVRDLELQRRTEKARDVAEAQLRFLVDTSDDLAATFNTGQALRRVAERAVPMLGDYCCVDLVEEGRLRRVAAVHRSDPGFEATALAFVPPADNPYHPVNQVLATGGPVLVTEITDDWVERVTVSDAHARSMRSRGLSGVLALPIGREGDIIGVLTLSVTGERTFSPTDITTARELVRRAAAAVTNARLFHRAEFQRSLLEAQGEASIDGLAVVDTDGDISWHNRRFSEIWALSPETVAAGDDAVLAAASANVVDPDAFVTRVRELYRTGATARDELAFVDGRTIERYGTPISAPDGSRYGYLWSFRDITERKRVEEELAHLYQRERDSSHRLQAGLLMVETPRVDQLTVTSAYRPAAAALFVGGDWFDSFPLPGGSVALVVGDVVGHGVDAAAVMGHLRGGVRSAAALVSPAGLLDVMTSMVAALPGATMSTIAFVRYDPADGSLAWACAGHPPPVVARADGRVEVLWGGRSGPLWASLRQPRAEATGRLEPGDTLVLYTDGLVERRGELLDAGLDRLAAALGGLALDAADLADRLCDRILAGAAQDDDVCVLTAHRALR
jgi:PAS domain S-box-containing protein